VAMIPPLDGNQRNLRISKLYQENRKKQ
jgi:hypothetical protein